MIEDKVQRWITADCAFRILAARTTETVREAARVADCSPEVASVYGRLLTGAGLFQLAQAPIDRVQVALKHSGSAGTLLADTWPGPTVRGRVENPRPSAGPVLGPGEIQVSRVRTRGGEFYESIVPLQGGSVAEAMQRYCLESEQLVSFFSLAAVVTNDGEIVTFGGLLIQALPEMRHQHLECLTETLEKTRFDDLVRAGEDPISSAETLLRKHDIQPIGEDQFRYSCRCSKEIAVRAVMTLDASEIEDIKTGGSETVTCEFCGSSYTVSAGDLLFD